MVEGPRRPFRDGDAEEWLKDQTVAIDLDRLSLLCRLAASVPPPGFHLVHYAGVLGSASKLRALVVPPPPAKTGTDAAHLHRQHPVTHRSRYRPWAELMKRTFQIGVEAHNIERLLSYLGEPLEPPKRAPARDPPYFQSKVMRRKYGRLN